MDPLDFIPAIWGDAEQIETEVQLKEIEHLLDTASESDVSKRDRVIFRLYYKQGMTAKAIASIPNFQLSTKGVESSLARTTRFLRLQISGSQMYRSSQPRQGFLSAVPPEESR
jgi:RNA polymerase sigma-70 factor (ECF subfamily)